MAKIQSTIDGQAENRYLKQAIAESDAACAWANNYCLKHDVSNLGKKISKIYHDQYESMRMPNEICRLAIKCYWIAQRTWEIEWAMDNAAGQVPEFKENRKHSETFEFANVSDDDRGEAFYFFLGENRYLYEDHLGAYLKLCINHDESHQMQDLLLVGIALYWFCQADELIAAGDFGTIDAMSDAFSALHNSTWNDTWHASKECADEEKSLEAKRKAKLRHAETYIKHQQIIDYWRTNISLDIANDLAADQLQKVFPDMAHRTLSRYVSAAKKEVSALPLASTL